MAEYDEYSVRIPPMSRYLASTLPPDNAPAENVAVVRRMLRKDLRAAEATEEP